MKKISGAKVAHLLQTLPGMLRTTAAERDDAVEKVAELRSKVDQYERGARVSKVAELAHNRRMVSLGDTVQDKVAAINDALANGKSLEVMEQAVEMSSPDGSLGGLEKAGSANTHGGTERSAASGQALLAYLQS